jgi:hypothetical protein
MRLVVQRKPSVVVKHGLGGGAFMRPWAHGLMSAFEWLPRAPPRGVGHAQACGQYTHMWCTLQLTAAPVQQEQIYLANAFH